MFWVGFNLSLIWFQPFKPNKCMWIYILLTLVLMYLLNAQNVLFKQSFAYV